MFKRRLVLTVPGLAAFALVGGLAFGQVGSAQDATPGGMMDEVPHPGHIHTGTCDELGDVVYPLEDATAGGMMGTPMAGMMDSMATPGAGMAGMAGMDMSEVVAQSMSTVDVALDDILAAEHAINFHESAENIGTYIACGDVTGTPEDGVLEIDLDELNGSGYEGMAMLADNGDGTTDVTVLLTHTDGMGTMGTPAAGDEAAAGEESAAVEIVDLSYDPAEITIPVGGTVTWTNDDVVLHTATAQDREALQSGTIAPGDSYEQTFDTAGSYDYFCEFHVNMKGTIVVE